MILLAVVWAHIFSLSYSKWIALPVILLTINLVAAIVYQPAFKRDPALLIFHVALAMLLPVALYGSLSGFKGHFELPEGANFQHQNITIRDQGLLHSYQLDNLVMHLVAMDATYIPGKRAQRLRARVIADDNEVVIAEHLPLIWRDYRIYVSKNIGFTGYFNFIDDYGQQLYGVNFPWLAGNQLRQANEVNVFGEPFWLKLEGVEGMLDNDMQPIPFVPPANTYVVFRQGDRRIELRLGDQVAVNGGTLVFRSIGGWQGFEISYDPAKRYLLSLSLIMCMAMVWYFWQRFTRVNWDS